MKEVQAPNSYNNFKIFLAGSIEMGTAPNWQEKLLSEFQETDCTFLNPRRDDWDSSWKQEISDPKFFEQVNWELQAMEDSDLIIVYFSPETKSPITLLELGLWVGKCPKKLLVHCPRGFWRKGNVDIVCNRYGIEMADDWNNLVSRIRNRLISKFYKDPVYVDPMPYINFELS